MGFRERPEYQDWRVAVFRLFGQKCIRCGYAGNIHAHHVMPVNEYPEFVFEPTNGVPLCGNCHTEIKGDELAHVDDLKRLQRAILGGEAVAVATNDPSESALRERAFAEPSNHEAVEKWFHVTADSQAVVDFYENHHEDVKTAPFARIILLGHLIDLRRWQDVVKEADEQLKILLDVDLEEVERRAGREVGGEISPEFEAITARLASIRTTALRELGRLHEAVAFLRGLIGRFPEVAILHDTLSRCLWDVFNLAHESAVQEAIENGVEGRAAAWSLIERNRPPAALDAIEESVCHALKAAELAPVEYAYVSQASFVLRVKRDYSSALRYGKRALALASTDEEKIDALQNIAQIFMRNKLYGDARSYLREALEIDDCNVDVIADISHCFYMDDNEREAIRMAKRGLMLDPQNQDCQLICSKLDDTID